MKTALYFAVVLSCLIRVCSSDRMNSEYEHMKSHLEGYLNLNITDMSLDELRFLYFRLHDLDGDSKLDGCELVKSLYDHLDVNVKNMTLSDPEIAYYVDLVLSTDDYNEDGFITFAEYSLSQDTRLTTSTGHSILGRS